MPLLNVPKPHITSLESQPLWGVKAPTWYKCQGVHGVTGWGYSPKVAYDHWRCSMEGRVYRVADHETIPSLE